MKEIRPLYIVNCRKQFIVLNIRICLFFLFVLYVPLSNFKAQVYDYSALQGADDYYGFAQYRIYVSDTVSIFKGVYFYPYGSGGDSRHLTADSAFKKLCNETGFAFLGVNLNVGTDNYHDYRFGLFRSILRALYSLAGQSHHPEIQYAPIFLEEYSQGAHIIYYFAWWRPEIVLGLIAEKFEPATFFAGPTIRVPGYLFTDQRDYNYPTLAFELNRARGALWSIAMQQNLTHDRITGCMMYTLMHPDLVLEYIFISFRQEDISR